MDPGDWRVGYSKFNNHFGTCSVILGLQSQASHDGPIQVEESVLQELGISCLISFF